MHNRATRYLAFLLLAVFAVGSAHAAPKIKIFDIPDDLEAELEERDKDIDLIVHGDGQDGIDPVVDPVQVTGEVAFWDQHIKELKTLEYLLTAEPWHYRCFGILRLERFKGPEVGECLVRAMQDPDWQVRCFALRAAARHGVEVPEGLFDQEKEGRVIRMAQRVEVEVSPATVKRIADKALRSRVPENAVLGIEIAARSGDPKLISQAKKRLGQVLQHMNGAVLVTVGDRLAEILDLPAAPSSVAAWQHYIKQNAATLQFPEFEPLTQTIRDQPHAPIAEISSSAFLSAVDYFDTLHQQELQIAVMMDGTGSMGGAIAQAQGQTNRLMITLNDFAKSMEMGVVVYRDEGDKPMLEAVQMTGKISKVRSFLFKVKAQGGGDAPEAVYAGLGALGELNWSSQAEKQVVIITDAPAHEENMKRIENALKAMRSDGLTTHVLLTRAGGATQECMQKIAEWGNGTLNELNETSDLAKTVLHFVVDPKMHENFDHLYDLYIDLGM